MRLVAAGIALASMLMAPGAHAIPVGVQDASGNYTGITGLDVGGTLYDVAFRDGRFTTTLGGILDFTTETAAAQAATAIYNALASIAGLAALDANPALAVGCGESAFPLACYIMTPFALNTGSVDVIAMRNGRESELVQNGNEYWGFGTNVDTTGFIDFAGSTYVWADWTRQGTPTPVPEPGTLGLMLAGLLLTVGGLRRRRA